MDEEYQRYCIDQAHAYLERIRRMGEDCAGLQAQIDDARARAEGIRGIDYSADYVTTSANADLLPDSVAEIQAKIREYVADLAAFEDERYKASKTINQLEDATESRALRYRYLLGWKWERIRNEIDYSWQGIMTLRHRALLHYYDVMPHNERDPRHPAI